MVKHESKCIEQKLIEFKEPKQSPKIKEVAKIYSNLVDSSKASTARLSIAELLQEAAKETQHLSKVEVRKSVDREKLEIEQLMKNFKKAQLH